MTELIKKKRARAAARGWLSRQIVFVEAILEDEDRHDIDELSSAMENLEARLYALQQAQTAVELEIPEEEMEEEIAAAADLFEQAFMVKTKLTKHMNRHRSTSALAPSEVSQTGPTVRLPKLNLPKFDGNVENWRSFWETFEANVGSQAFPSITKFTYLQSCLVGDARRAVSGLSLTAENYTHACNILETRFGKQERIVFAHIQGLLNLAIATPSGCKNEVPTVDALRQMQDKLLSHVRSLQSLDIDGNRYGVFLTPMILSKLPENMRLQWSRTNLDNKETDVDGLLRFLETEISTLELSRSFKVIGEQRPATEHAPKKAASGMKFKQRSTTAALPSASPAQSTSCAFCGGGHAPDDCGEVRDLDVPARKQRTYQAGLCFRCLRSGHRADQCGARCTNCTGKHHAIFCFRQTQAAGSSASVGRNAVRVKNEEASLSCVDRPCSNQVVLPTARVNVHGPKGVVSATLLFDTGSQRTFVSKNLVKRVGAECLGSQRVSFAAFGGSRSPDEERGVFNMKVSGANLSTPNIHSFPAVEVPVICAPLCRPCVPLESLKSFENLEFADQFFEGDELKIDILCGLDVFWTLMQADVSSSSEGLVAQNSVFGWVLSGVCSGGSEKSDPVCSQLLSLGDLHESTIRSFWDLEAIGISSKEDSLGNNPVLQRFEETIEFNHELGRYRVQLPWKETPAETQLQNNRHLAEKRLRSLNRKLDKTPELRERYDQALREMETNGVVTDVVQADVTSSHPVFYLPHKPVLKVYPGRDGIRRSADIRTKRGILTRPIQKLHDLELAEADSAPLDQNESNQHGTDFAPADRMPEAAESSASGENLVTRSGRRVKPPNR